MTFYTDLAADAASLIAEFGQAMTLTRRVVYNGAADSTSPGFTPETTSTARAVALPMDGARVGQDIGGTAIKSTDAAIWISPTAPTAPENGDTISDGVDTWALLRVNALRPGGVLLAYDCVGRK